VDFKRLAKVTFSWIGSCGILFLALPLSAGQAASAGFDPGDFVKGINNPYFPCKPGAVFIYSGNTEEGLEVLQIIVSPLKKTIRGVECTIVNETVTVDGLLVEVAMNWYAQDKQGNVWYFGEDSKDYRNGQVVSTKGSWKAGVNGARQGIIMEAHPQVGDIYPQEIAPGVAEDMAQVLSLSKPVKVPYDDFDRCLYTKEWSPLEPNVVEYKYYAKGVGFILGITGGGERLVLRHRFQMAF